MYLMSFDIADELFAWIYAYRNGSKTSLLKELVIDCQCRDEELITSHTTIIISSRFKFTYTLNTCFVPELTGGIKRQFQNATFLKCISKENTAGCFLRTVLFIKEVSHVN